MAKVNDSYSSDIYGRMKALANSLGIPSENFNLLNQSLLHTSYINDHPNDQLLSNERLEFLGDAVLDFVVAEYLYKENSDMSEGSLTVARAALVREETLARVARNLSLGEYLRLGQGEEITGGRNRDSNLAGALEALIGAILLDLGMERASAFVLTILNEEINNISINGLPKDPKSRLQELIQAEYKSTPSYRVVDEFGPGHAKHFVVEAFINDNVLGRGSGARKTDAERNSAIDALARLDKGLIVENKLN